LPADQSTATRAQEVRQTPPWLKTMFTIGADGARHRLPAVVEMRLPAGPMRPDLFFP
jgi:hypothetical protein